MRESVTYQKVLEEGRIEGRAEGRAEEARRIIVLQATRRFGPPDHDVRARLGAIIGPDRLEELAERVFKATSWAELLDVNDAG